MKFIMMNKHLTSIFFSKFPNGAYLFFIPSEREKGQISFPISLTNIAGRVKVKFAANISRKTPVSFETFHIQE